MVSEGGEDDIGTVRYESNESPVVLDAPVVQDASVLGDGSVVDASLALPEALMAYDSSASHS